MLQLLSAVAHAVACEPQAENCCSRIFCTLGPGQPYFWLCQLRYSQLVLNPAWLHGTPAAVLGGPPTVLTSLWLCRPHPSNFSWALFRDSGPATYAKVSVLLHEPFSSGTLLQLRLHLHWYPLLDILTWLSVILLDPFMPWKSVPHQRLLHTAKFKLQRHVQPWSPLDHRASVCWSRGNISQKTSP